MGKYDYLKKYVNKSVSNGKENSFYTFDLKRIENCERKLGYTFPEELKEFWMEIGYGFFRSSVPEKGINQNDWTNRLATPDDIMEILLEGAESELITETGLDLLDEGALPFFEVSDSTSFISMKPNSEDPHAIYYLIDYKIADSLEEFVYRLYYESPIYYLNIVD
jgi:hypothetical protein